MAYIARAKPVFTFVESTAFDRFRPMYLDDEDYANLQRFMVANPEAGDVVPRSGGVRKLRWRVRGRGKRGGLRVIYRVRYDPDELWMLTIYSKSELDDVPGHILRQLMDAFRDD